MCCSSCAHTHSAGSARAAKHATVRRITGQCYARALGRVRGPLQQAVASARHGSFQPRSWLQSQAQKTAPGADQEVLRVRCMPVARSHRVGALSCRRELHTPAAADGRFNGAVQHHSLATNHERRLGRRASGCTRGTHDSEAARMGSQAACERALPAPLVGHWGIGRRLSAAARSAPAGACGCWHWNACRLEGSCFPGMFGAGRETAATSRGRSRGAPGNVFCRRASTASTASGGQVASPHPSRGAGARVVKAGPTQLELHSSRCARIAQQAVTSWGKRSLEAATAAQLASCSGSRLVAHGSGPRKDKQSKHHPCRPDSLAHSSGAARTGSTGMPGGQGSDLRPRARASQLRFVAAALRCWSSQGTGCSRPTRRPSGS